MENTGLRKLPIGIQDFESLLMSTIHSYFSGRKDLFEALAQIQDRNYTLPFAIEDQRIVRIGINFDSKTRNIDKCLVG